MSLGPYIQANRKSIELELELAVRLGRLIAFRELTSLEWGRNILIMSSPQVIIALQESLSELLIAFPIENHVDAAVNFLLPLLFEFLSLLKTRFSLVLRVVISPFAAIMMMTVCSIDLTWLMPDVKGRISSFPLEAHSVGWYPRHVMVFLFCVLKMVRKTSRNIQVRFLGSKAWLGRIHFNHRMRNSGVISVKS